MADTLYLSLWYPNLLLEALASKLTAVLGVFAAHGGEANVYAATVWPVNWSETPVFQRVYGRMGGDPESSPGAAPQQAVEEALELLHDDYAYEFQIGWSLWELESAAGDDAVRRATADPHSTSSVVADSAQGRLSTSAAEAAFAQDDTPNLSGQNLGSSVPLSSRWVRGSRLVRVTAYGPLFDDGAYEQEGHIRIDFGSDAPFLEEDAELDRVGAQHVEENVRQLVELAAGVEKASGATARLLWSELGESLAQRLAERLGIRSS